MAAKIQQNFSFVYPLKEIITNSLGLHTRHIGDLTIEGIGYCDPKATTLDIFERYHYHIEYIKKDGTDFKEELLFLIDPIKMDDLKTALIHHIADNLFKDEFPPVAIEPVPAPQNAKLEDLKAYAMPAGDPFSLPDIEVFNNKGESEFVINGIMVTEHGNLFIRIAKGWFPLKDTETNIINRLWQCLCHKSAEVAL